VAKQSTAGPLVEMRENSAIEHQLQAFLTAISRINAAVIFRWSVSVRQVRYNIVILSQARYNTAILGPARYNIVILSPPQAGEGSQLKMRACTL